MLYIFSAYKLDNFVQNIDLQIKESKHEHEHAQVSDVQV